MKNLLIITYDFPPKKSISCLRPASMVKYFPLYNFHPFILTPLVIEREFSSDIIETYLPFREILGIIKKKQFHCLKNKINTMPNFFLPSLWTRLISVPREIVPIPDSKIGWKNYAVYSAIKIIKKENIKTIITTSRPNTAHIVGHCLKKKLPEIKWIANFQDLWTQYHCSSYRGLRYKYENFLEKKVISLADVLTTVSENWKDKLKEKFNKPSFAIPTGFDPAEISDNPPLNSKKFNMVYTGSLYFGENKQNPERFVKIIKNLLEKKLIKRDKLEIIFYGKYKDRNNLFFKSIKENSLEDIFKFHGFLPREEILKIQRTAQVLLLFDWNDSKEKGVCPGKIFEYIASKRPILAIGKYDGDMKKIIEKTNAGFFCKTDEEIENIILNLYHEWEKNGKISYYGKEDAINEYSQIKSIEKFSEIINKIDEWGKIK